MVWFATGFLLMISMFLSGRNLEEVRYQGNESEVYLEGKVVNKQYKESSYGGYWQVTLKQVKVLEKTWEPGKTSLEVAKKERFEKVGSREQKRNEEVTEEVRKNHKSENLRKLEGKYLCQIQTSGLSELKIGQQILLTGKYSPWEKPSNPGEFDIEKYYGSLGILGQFRKCHVLKQSITYWKIREGMWRLRQEADSYFRQELGEADGALISAMLLGEKSGLEQEDKNLYQRNGISHILAISGLHLMLLGMGVFKFLKVILGIKPGAVLSIIIMSVYCVFTGNSISTIRATIMFALSFIAGLSGRSYDSLSALGLAAIVQLFINPYVLHHSGFLLSFLAVIGVTFIAPQLQELFGAKRRISRSLCISISASITTLPVLLCNYGTYPWYSVFLNLFILPPMSVLLFLAAILGGILFAESLLPGIFAGNLFWTVTEGEKAGLLLAAGEGRADLLLAAMGENGNVISTLKSFPVMGIKLILNYFEICCKIFEHAPFQDGYLGSPSLIQIMIYGVLIIVAITRGKKCSKFASKMMLLSAIGILTLQIHTGVELTMLDVGQGDSIVIRNQNGNVYISDCGSSSVSKVGKYRLIPFLKYKGYGKIKGIFISHLDNDHINGIVELLEMAPEERVEISYLFLPESVLWIEEDREIVLELQELAKQNKTQVVYLKQGDKIQDGSMEFHCLYPSGSKESGTFEDDRNNRSLVLFMQYKDFELLLTGDLEKEGEIKVLEYVDRISKSVGRSGRQLYRTIDVLKVAHHGSYGSSSGEFLEVMCPALSLISCGKNNTYGHPHEETVERLCNSGSKIMSTVDSGAITLKIKKNVRVYEFRETKK